MLSSPDARLDTTLLSSVVEKESNETASSEIKEKKGSGFQL